MNVTGCFYLFVFCITRRLIFNTLNQVQTSTPEPKGKAVKWLTKRPIQEQKKLVFWDATLLSLLDVCRQRAGRARNKQKA
jgi:hypothetical protein